MKRPGLAGALARIAGAVALGAAARGVLSKPDEGARSLVAARRSRTLDGALPVLTDLGSTYAVGGAAAALFAFGRRRLARDVVAAGLVAWGAAQVAKALFARPRPYDASDVDLLVRRPAGTSYPSGHPAVAAAVARVVGPAVRAPARTVVERLPRFVAFTRVYVGAHYPTDVIGGMLLGRAVGDLWLRYARRSRV